MPAHGYARKVREAIISNNQTTRKHEPYKSREDQFGRALDLPHHEGQDTDCPDRVTNLIPM